MHEKKSREALLDFLDYLARKGLVNKTTIAARRAAVNNVLGILETDEAHDVFALDLDEVMQRFNNLHGMRYRSDSLSTYKSRVKSAIDDFSSYLSDPMTYKPSVNARRRRGPEKVELAGSTNRGEKAEVKSNSIEPHSTPSTPSLPIPIRADLTVYVQGLPFDLTSGEASKIANVVKAMAASE